MQGPANTPAEKRFSLGCCVPTRGVPWREKEGVSLTCYDSFLCLQTVDGAAAEEEPQDGRKLKVGAGWGRCRPSGPRQEPREGCLGGKGAGCAHAREAP